MTDRIPIPPPPWHWRFLDKNFRVCWPRYLLQCGIATAVIFLVLTLLDGVRQTVLIAAFGSSAFVAFSMPHTESARPRFLIGGYCVGTSMGCLFSVLGDLSLLAALPLIALGALAVGASIFVMVVTNTEHPPAAGLALGFVINPWDGESVFVVIAGIVAISLTKEIIKSRLINLIMRRPADAQQT